MGRPSFNEAWSAFGKVNFPVADVGRIIGGNVGQNISGGYFENACPIRMSYVLNATGFPISRSSPYACLLYTSDAADDSDPKCRSRWSPYH